MEQQTHNEDDAGAILFSMLCASAGIRDWRRMDIDDKNKLISFLNSEINHYEFTLDQLNRNIRNVVKGKYKEKITSQEPTICDLCYIALKNINPGIRLFIREYKNAKHARYIHADEFNSYLERLKPGNAHATAQMSSDRFPPSNWYVYINVFDKDTRVRSTGRRVLSFTAEGQQIRVDYFITDRSISDWYGYVPREFGEEFVVLHLKTTEKNDRYLDIWLRTGKKELPSMIHGELTFTTIDGQDICHPPVVMVAIPEGEPYQPAVIREGDDPTIAEIETYLVKTANKNVVNNVPLHECGHLLNKK